MGTRKLCVAAIGRFVFGVAAIVWLLVSCSSGGDDALEVSGVIPVPVTTSEVTIVPTATSTPSLAPEPTAAPESEASPEPEATDVAEATSEVDVAAAESAGHDAPGDLVVPIPLPPGAPGDIIDTEPITIVGGFGQRILYHSRSATDENVAVSGFVVYPDGEPPEGGWPLIAWAHGTTGLEDQCAPSMYAEKDPLATGLVQFGFAVVATDYEGLGTPGRHPYIVGVSEGRNVLDSVRAAAKLDLPISDRWVAFGHSQGGHAALFAGQLWPDYAPELDLIGVAAGAPASQMRELSDALIGSNFQGYTVMSVAGLSAAYPNLDIADVLTDEALADLDVLDTGCLREIFSVYNAYSFEEFSRVDDIFEVDGWGDALTSNDTNRQPVTVPLFIYQGGDDEQIPVETSAALFDQLCQFADQGPTTRKVYPGQSHGGVLTSFAAIPDLIAWSTARFAGTEAPDGCAEL